MNLCSFLSNSGSSEKPGFSVPKPVFSGLFWPCSWVRPESVPGLPVFGPDGGFRRLFAGVFRGGFGVVSVRLFCGSVRRLGG